MSEEQKTTEPVATDVIPANPLLPKVDYPTMDMPEEPKVEGNPPEGAPHVSCEGTLPEAVVPPPGVTEPTPGIPRILIGIPILSYSHEFVESFLKFWTQLCTQHIGKLQVGYHFIYRKPVHMAEQTLVEIAMANKCTHILFMDDDIYSVTAEDLWKLIDADKDVIGGVMYASKFPHAMCVFRRYNAKLKVIDMPADNSMYRLYEIPCRCECGFSLSHWDIKFCPVCSKPQNQLIQQADLIPFAFTLTKMSVFEKLRKPWFHCTNTYPTDSWFADRLLEAGLTEYAHMGVRLNHNGVNDITRPFMVQMGLEQNKAKGMGVIHLSQDDMFKHEHMLHSKMIEAEERLKPKPDMIETNAPQPVPA